MNTKELKQEQELFINHMGNIVKGNVDKIYDGSITVRVKNLCLSEENTFIQCHNWHLTLEDCIKSFINETNKKFLTNYKIDKNI